MAGHYLRKRLRTARLARRLAGFSCILLAVSILVFRFGGVDFEAFLVLAALVGAMAATALLIASSGLLRVWRSGHEGGGMAVAAFLIASLVMSPFALASVLALRNPPTNAAETDGMAEVAADGEAQPEPVDPPDGASVGGRVFPVRAPQIYQAVRLVLADVGWTVSDVETADPQTEELAREDVADGVPPSIAGQVPVPTRRNVPGEEAEETAAPDPLDRPEAGEYRISAIAASAILALPSDVEIRIVEDEAQAYLDLRSVSRFGTRDLGQNRRFIEDFLARVDAAMIGAVSPGGDG